MQIQLLGNITAEECTKELAGKIVDSLNTQAKLIVTYIRNKNGHRIGVLVAYKKKGDEEVLIGVSKCNFKSGDRFDRNKGIIAAIDNSVPLTKILPNAVMSKKQYGQYVEQVVNSLNKKLPNSVVDDYVHMVYRAKRYFDIA